MFNPFTEVIDESADFDLIFQAKNGNRDALENLVLRHQAWKIGRASCRERVWR